MAALLKQHPAWLTWGTPEPRFENVFDQRSVQAFPTSEPFTEYVIRLANRDAVLAFLRSSPRGLGSGVKIRSTYTLRATIRHWPSTVS